MTFLNICCQLLSFMIMLPYLL
uniref:Uncharacterized protein n=1 Tax=Rhizophora mucronata TaxID=61149 RepID=A0A2P2QFU8_RHIMU